MNICLLKMTYLELKLKTVQYVCNNLQLFYNIQCSYYAVVFFTEKGAQRVLIVVSTILGVAILGVIIVMVAFLLFAKRRRYRTDDSLSQSSTKSLPVQTNMKA